MNRSDPQPTPVRPAEAFPEPPVRGERVLRLGERAFLALDRWTARLIPRESWNPFARTGAIAMTTFLVASVTGVLLLFWYDASVTGAYGSVEAMMRAPWTAGLLRSLHRYSSDACLFIVTVHMLQVLFQRRFAGARWLAWCTGFLLLFLLWVVGWLGYWLVWDERAQLVATESAEMLDVVPIFADPLSRSFLVDEEVNTLLFFMVFFVHMLLPLGMGVLLWLHIARVARPRFLTDRVLTAWVLGSLVALSLIAPADLAEPAHMTREPAHFAMDAWYLAPLALAQRMSVGAAWVALVVIGMAGMSVPWLLGRRARATPAEVEPSRCVSCLRCFQDCPYGAISMIPRTDGREDLPSQADVDPMRCVGCGICTGSCDTAGVGVPQLPMLDARKQARRWAEEAAAAGREEWMLVACGASAAGALEVDARDGRCAELPGWRVMPAPCAGWLQASVVDAALRRGLQGVMVMACGPGECHFREGVQWTEDRLSGSREPVLRADRVDPRRAEVVRLDRTRAGDVPAAAQAFQKRVAALNGEPPAPARGPHRRERRARLRHVAGGALVALLLGGITWAGSVVPWSSALDAQPRLVVSFKHAGALLDAEEGADEEESDRPVHMRGAGSMARERSPVRLRVEVDGEVVLDRAYPPRGLWGDGSSIAVESLPVGSGRHEVRVLIDEDPAGDGGWDHRARRTLEFTPRHRRVVLFDRERGFTFHP